MDYLFTLIKGIWVTINSSFTSSCLFTSFLQVLALKLVVFPQPHSVSATVKRLYTNCMYTYYRIIWLTVGCGYQTNCLVNPLLHFAPPVPQNEWVMWWNTEDLWSWLERTPSNAYTAYRSTLLTSTGTDSGLLWGSEWDSELLKLGFNKDFCSVIWNKPGCPFHLLYNTYKTKENPYTARDCS